MLVGERARGNVDGSESITIKISGVLSLFRIKRIAGVGIVGI